MSEDWAIFKKWDDAVSAEDKAEVIAEELKQAILQNKDERLFKWIILLGMRHNSEYPQTQVSLFNSTFDQVNKPPQAVKKPRGARKGLAWLVLAVAGAIVSIVVSGLYERVKDMLGFGP